jgi:hypothetical protein
LEEGVTMEMSSIVHHYYHAFIDKHGQTALPSHLKTLNAIRRCRTPESGELYVKCPECDFAEWRPLSCGNRNCPKCQNHTASQWIDKQQAKLLPVPYFMVTFTLPYELRFLAWCNQKLVYSLLFTCVASVLKDFGKHPKSLNAEIGMTMVLHTNNRKLDFHPHIHAVVPGGGMNKRSRQWKRIKGDYLFHQKSLAKVFRARFLVALKQAGLLIPKNIPAKWVVDCSHVGTGISALKYLSRYLYRGVISEKSIVSNKNGFITFRYTESGTKRIKYRRLKGEDFLQLIMQHVLPQGFRRVRDYGFLHGNAKRIRSLIQLILRVIIPPIRSTPRPAFKCSCCQAAMVIIAFRRNGGKAG